MQANSPLHGALGYVEVARSIFLFISSNVAGQDAKMVLEQVISQIHTMLSMLIKVCGLNHWCIRREFTTTNLNHQVTTGWLVSFNERSTLTNRPWGLCCTTKIAELLLGIPSCVLLGSESDSSSWSHQVIGVFSVVWIPSPAFFSDWLNCFWFVF